jgi:hypothetical protein
MSKFDPNALLQTELQVSDIATVFVPIPEGTFPIQFGAPKIESGEKNGRVWARLETPVTITDPAVAEEMGLDSSASVKSMYTLFLDIDPATNALATGVNKNVRLGQLLQAVGLEGNAALADLENRTALGKFKQRMSDAQRVLTELKEVLADD